MYQSNAILRYLARKFGMKHTEQYHVAIQYMVSILLYTPTSQLHFDFTQGVGLSQKFHLNAKVILLFRSLLLLLLLLSIIFISCSSVCLCVTSHSTHWLDSFLDYTHNFNLMKIHTATMLELTVMRSQRHFQSCHILNHHAFPISFPFSVKQPKQQLKGCR